MSNSIGMYRTWNKMLGQWQYVAPDYYSFYDVNGKRLGKIIWRKMSEIEGIYIDKDDDETETEEDSI